MIVKFKHKQDSVNKMNILWQKRTISALKTDKNKHTDIPFVVERQAGAHVLVKWGQRWTIDSLRLC